MSPASWPSPRVGSRRLETPRPTPPVFALSLVAASGLTRSHAPRGNAVLDAPRPRVRASPGVRRRASKTAFPRRTVGTRVGTNPVVLGGESRRLCRLCRFCRQGEGQERSHATHQRLRALFPATNLPAPWRSLRRSPNPNDRRAGEVRTQTTVAPAKSEPKRGLARVDRTQTQVAPGWTEPKRESRRRSPNPNGGLARVDRTQTRVAPAKSEPKRPSHRSGPNPTDRRAGEVRTQLGSPWRSPNPIEGAPVPVPVRSGTKCPGALQFSCWSGRL
jgi:hypothetical protein